MDKLLATINKELTILWRDRAGMLVLFVMPAVLVLVITLVQENVLKIMGESTISIVLIDADNGLIGQKIRQQLLESGKITIVSTIDGRPITAQLAIAEVAAGTYQACIVVPAGSSASLKRRARQVMEEGFGAKYKDMDVKISPQLKVYFDPTVLAGFRNGLVNVLNMVAAGIVVEEKMREFFAILPGKLAKEIKDTVGPSAADMVKIPALKFSWDKTALLTVQEEAASRQGLAMVPTSVQQNVPAWSLFGIFFIVVPLAGALLKERQDGTLSRLLTMPVSFITLLCGKVVAYVLVCSAQLIFILIIGKFLLPALGTAEFVIGPHYILVIFVSVCAILAATGYGIMLGAVCRTFEQAAMFGAISVVVAAALGGIMVPVYAMPKMMQMISHVSPLAWGLNAYLDVFVRGGGLVDVADESALLLTFFAVNMIVAWMVLFQRLRRQ